MRFMTSGGNIVTADTIEAAQALAAKHHMGRVVGPAPFPASMDWPTRFDSETLNACAKAFEAAFEAARKGA